MKESLQEATQRALLEGYKNLKENKSKKTENKMSNARMLDLISEMFFWLDEVLDKDDIDGALNAIGVSKAEFEGDKDIPDDKLLDVLNNTIDYVSEHLSPSDEKNTFKNSIGFTDEEMKELGMVFEDDELEESKKVESNNDEYNYYEIYFDFSEGKRLGDDGYSKFFKSKEDVEDNTDEIIELAKSENILDEDDLADIANVAFAIKIDKDEYERATRTKVESKKVEAYNYNWRDDIDEVENTEENDELVYAFAENLMNTDPDYAEYDDPWEIISNIISIWKINKRSRLYDYLIKWYGSEEEMKKHVRSFYETNDAIYFETGCGYSIFDADLLGGNADGETARAFDTFVANGGKKEESKKEESLDEIYTIKYNDADVSLNIPQLMQLEKEHNVEVGAKQVDEIGNWEVTVTGTKENIKSFMKDVMGINYEEISDDDFEKVTESKKVEAKRNFINNVDELPDMCYGLLPSDNSIIIIKKGESGYYETDLGSPENAEEVVNDLNEKMGVTPDQRFTMEIRSINNNWKDTKTEGKKVESELSIYGGTVLYSAIRHEVRYWLQVLVDENSNDEIGKKAQAILDDDAEIEKIVNELVDGSDDLWEDIHRRIENLAGLDYAGSSRVNENKKVTEGLIDSVADYIILRDYNDYKSNDPWQELFVFDHKLSDEEKDKIQKAIDEAKEDPDYDNELVEEKINEVVPFVSNEILKFDEGKIFYY